MEQLFKKKLTAGLFFTRMSVFLVFLMWTWDKFVNPDHGLRVFEHFYGMTVTSELITLMGWAQLILVVVFGLGLWKKWSYLAILVLHGGSTFSSMALYFDPLNNLLFFAAWPMFASCVLLFMFREYDSWDIYLLRAQKNAS